MNLIRTYYLVYTITGNTTQHHNFKVYLVVLEVHNLQLITWHTSYVYRIIHLSYIPTWATYDPPKNIYQVLRTASSAVCCELACCLLRPDRGEAWTGYHHHHRFVAQVLMGDRGHYIYEKIQEKQQQDHSKYRPAQPTHTTKSTRKSAWTIENIRACFLGKAFLGKGSEDFGNRAKSTISNKPRGA